MVRKCVVCKKSEISNPGLVFRRLPLNSERRMKWISILDLGNQRLTKYAQICSDHFDKSDIMTTEITGRILIRADAEPRLYTTVFTEPLSYSSDSSISDFSPRKFISEGQSVVPCDCLGASPYKDSQKSPSGTSTASETEDDINMSSTYNMEDLQNEIVDEEQHKENMPKESEPEKLQRQKHPNELEKNHDYQKIVIKSEVEDVVEKSDRGEELLFANKCKLEIETYDEFCSKDASGIYLKEFNSNIIKAEGTLKNGERYEPSLTGHYLNKVKLEPDQGSAMETEKLVSANKCKIKMEVETYDEFCNADVRSIFFEEFNNSIIKAERTSEATFASETDYTGNKQSQLKVDNKQISEVQLESVEETGAIKLDHTYAKQSIYDNTANSDTDTATEEEAEDSYNENNDMLAKTKSCVNQYKHLELAIIKTKIKESLRKYQLMHLEEHPVYKCDRCDYSTKNKALMKQHHITTHSTVKPFKCDKCSFQTRNRLSIYRHRLVHTEERPFKCDNCDYSAKVIATLRKHKKCIHGDNYN